MNNAGDAAEQIVRMSLEGTEVALRLFGSAAKNIAVALYAISRDAGKNQTKGQQKLNAMLKSGKELKVFTVGENDLARFAEESKRYGVVYCVLQPKGRSPDGNVDILVRAEDASKINRIVERFQLSAVDNVHIKHDTNPTKARTERNPQSEPIFKGQKSGRSGPDEGVTKSSVKDELRKIKAERGNTRMPVPERIKPKKR